VKSPFEGILLVLVTSSALFFGVLPINLFLHQTLRTFPKGTGVDRKVVCGSSDERKRKLLVVVFERNLLLLLKRYCG
jgi:hypothetical protein